MNKKNVEVNKKLPIKMKNKKITFKTQVNE